MRRFQLDFNQNGARIFFDQDNSVEARRHAAGQLACMLYDRSGTLTALDTEETWRFEIGVKHTLPRRTETKEVK